MKPGQALRIFERDSFTCAYCGKQYPPESPPLHAHHRIFKSQGGQDDDENLAACCFSCHYNHGDLKGRRLIWERDDSVIEGLRRRYMRGK